MGRVAAAVAVFMGEVGTAASQIHQAAGHLATQAENLRGEVDRFIAKVRGA